MRIILIVVIVVVGLVAGLLLGQMAHAQTPYQKFYTLGPGTYAVRSLCPPVGQMQLIAFDPTGNIVLAQSSDFCVNGRTGITFTVPDGPIVVIRVVLWIDRDFGSPKFKLNADCLDSAATACTLTDAGLGSGVITYPGDYDWFHLPIPNLPLTSIRVVPAKAGCFVSGRVHQTPDSNDAYLEVFGGPSGCPYTVTAVPRPSVE